MERGTKAEVEEASKTENRSIGTAMTLPRAIYRRPPIKLPCPASNQMNLLKMKTPIRTALALVSTLALTPFASAQTEIRSSTTASDGTTTAVSTTTTAGTISEIGAGTLIIRSETSPQPIRYRFGKTTSYVDETGAPVSFETVKSGLPVTVYYVREGDQMIANRVVVRKQTTTGTSAVAPTVIERNTTITRHPVVVEKPVYVDRVIEKPVIVEKKVMVPVEKKVYVERPVVVEKPVIVEKTPPAPMIIEKKTTTTTTTTDGKK